MVITKNRKIKQQEKHSLETKMQVIRRLDTSERQFQIGTALNLEATTIMTILKKKEKILSSETATTKSSATGLIRSKNNTIDAIEKRLPKWIDDEIERNMPLS
ncbi:hypothetical protein TNCV_1992181 [Trichonephila clavipes]|nr:hypothetical protein TNCV_1992181 [Trichonephila clavipes]